MTKIKYHWKQDCSWCIKWTKVVEPWINPNYLEKIEGGVNSYPTFIIQVDDKEETLVGYQTISKIYSTIKKLRDGNGPSEPIGH